MAFANLDHLYMFNRRKNYIFMYVAFANLDI